MRFYGIVPHILLLFVLSGSSLLAQKKQSKAGQPSVQATENESDKENSSSSEDEGPIVALVGAEIRTLSAQGVIAQGVLVLQGDKIAAVGDADTEIPEGAEVLQLEGCVITPGLINARSSLWLTSASASASASDASLNILDGIDPYSEDWKEVIRHGVTSVYVQPSSSGSLSGFGAVVSTAPQEAEGVVGPEVHAELVALQASLGVGARTNRTRSQQLDRLKRALDSAKAYQKKWKEYNEYIKKKEASKPSEKSKDTKGKTLPVGRPATGRPPSPDRKMPSRPGVRRPGPPGSRKPAGEEEEKKDGEDSKDEKDSSEKSADKKEDAKESAKKAPEKPDLDPIKERLVKVLEGEIPIRLELNTSDDFHYISKLFKDFDSLQFVFQGLTDVGSAHSDIAELGCPVVLGPWIRGEAGYRDDPDSRTNWAEQFANYEGTLVLGTSGSARSSRLLRFHVGAAMAAGVERDRALAAVTLDAARVLGVSDVVGSIEPGKRADIACFAGEPTDASVPLRLVMSGARVVYEYDAPAFSAVANVADESPSLESLAGAGGAIVLRSDKILRPDGSWQAGYLALDAEGRLISQSQEKPGVDGTVIDLGGYALTPGLCSAHANLGIQRLVDPSFADATYVVAADSFSHTIPQRAELIESGLLRCLLAPGSSNPIAGQASLLRLGSHSPVVSSSACLKMVVSSDARSVNRFPSSLAGQIQLLRQTFEGTQLESRLFIPATVQKRLDRLRAEAVKQTLDGAPSLIVAETDAEIRAALDLTETYDLNTLLATPLQLAPFVDRLVASDVTVVAKPLGVSDYNWYPDDLAAAAQAGVKILFAGENAEQLRMTAAAAVAAGMSRENALSALCFGTDEALGEESGVWKQGQPADIVVWSASPLGLAARAEASIIDGVVSLTQEAE